MRSTRPILSVGAESSPHPKPVPMEITREPLQQLESALARGPVAPRGGHLGHAHAEAVCLDCELQTKLEASARLDGDLVEEALGVEAEVAGRVVDWQPAQPVQRSTTPRSVGTTFSPSL